VIVTKVVGFVFGYFLGKSKFHTQEEVAAACALRGGCRMRAFNFDHVRPAHILSHSPVSMQWIFCGLAGLIAALLIEMILFVIRSDGIIKQEEKAKAKKPKK
jgi:hypothetical protein